MRVQLYLSASIFDWDVYAVENICTIPTFSSCFPWDTYFFARSEYTRLIVIDAMRSIQALNSSKHSESRELLLIVKTFSIIDCFTINVNMYLAFPSDGRSMGPIIFECRTCSSSIFGSFPVDGYFVCFAPTQISQSDNKALDGNAIHLTWYLRMLLITTNLGWPRRLCQIFENMFSLSPSDARQR